MSGVVRNGAAWHDGTRQGLFRVGGGNRVIVVRQAAVGPGMVWPGEARIHFNTEAYKCWQSQDDHAKRC